MAGGRTLLLDVPEPVVAGLERWAGDLDLEHHSDPESLLGRLRRETGDLDLVVVGPDTSGSIELAQQIRSLDEDLGVVILTPPGQQEPRAEAIRLSPFLGSQTSSLAIGAGKDGLAQLRKAAWRTQRRRQNRAWLNAAQQSLQRTAGARVQPAALLGHFLEHAPVGLQLVTPGSALVAENERARELLGRGRGQQPYGLGAHLSEVFAPFAPERVEALVQRALSSDEPSREQVSGGSRHLDLTAASMSNEAHGRIAMLVIQDVSDSVRAERALRRANRDLERLARELTRSNKDLEQFAYVASHDLQEPLRMVSSFVTLLAQRYRGQLDEEADRFIQYAVDGAKRMQGLINDLLRYSRSTQGEVAMESVDLSELLEEVLSNLRRAVEESGAQITSDPLPTVPGRSAQLHQVLQNLVENGIKYRGEAPPRIEVTAAREEHEWVISVRDHGVGFAPNQAERIFRIFQRLGRRDDSTGNGIGLAIVKRVVERHGGRVWARSSPGEGSTFSFTLPISDDAKEAT